MGVGGHVSYALESLSSLKQLRTDIRFPNLGTKKKKAIETRCSIVDFIESAFNSSAWLEN